MIASVRGGVLGLGRLERRHARRDRLGAGEGDGARLRTPAEQDQDRDVLGACWVAGSRRSGS